MKELMIKIMNREPLIYDYLYNQIEKLEKKLLELNNDNIQLKREVEVLTDTLKNREYTKKKWKELQEENKRLKDYFKIQHFK